MNKKPEDSFAKNLLRHPRRLWLRKAVFQVHLWIGLMVALYLVVISLSGSVLVSKDELVRSTLPTALHPFDERRVAAPEDVLRAFKRTMPDAQLDTLQFPSAVLPAYLLIGADRNQIGGRWFADPQTGDVTASPHTWLDWVYDFHYYLLLPHAWGMQANGMGAVALLLLAASGLVLWWQGLKLWTRGLRVSMRARWRRVNYDLHSAIGFWTFAIVLWWAISGTYFAWYREVTKAIAVVSPVVGMQSPPATLTASPVGCQTATLAQVLAIARSASPEGRLWSISNPLRQAGDAYVLLDRAAAGDFSHRDIIRIRNDGQLLSVWHYGERHTVADWLLWSMHPLHFGTLWGTAAKLLWATLGISLACLTTTGCLMYWNRYLSTRRTGT